MTFGRNTAPELCELMLSVVSWLRRQRGVKHCRYCDDIPIFGATEEECILSIDIALEVLELFGLAVAHPKTVRACQRIVFLGIVLDSIRMVRCTLLLHVLGTDAIAWGDDYVHTAAVVDDWITEQGFGREANFPPRSPDLNLIENVFGIMVERMSNQKVKHR